VSLQSERVTTVGPVANSTECAAGAGLPAASTDAVTAPATSDTLTVLYDGACPLCRREIAHMQGLAKRGGDSRLCFADISGTGGGIGSEAERAMLLARFHVQRADGTRLDGAAAFVEMWRRLPGWRLLARVARLPGMLPLLELAYRAFLRVRPALQALARRRQSAAQVTSRLSLHMERELRSDHAGETGAVFIYRGIAAVAAWRRDAQMLEFAQRHGATEAEHLQLLEVWLPAARRSLLLGPWRLAGWLTGALPALAGTRAMHGTIAAVETFVDRHYQQQIDHIRCQGGPDELLALLQRCQADELHHRDEAAALAGPRLPWPLRVWCALVGAGSAGAVVVARRF
jgi:3-demethoxyubiquinol 3-hydroxylase